MKFYDTKSKLRVNREIAVCTYLLSPRTEHLFCTVIRALYPLKTLQFVRSLRRRARLPIRPRTVIRVPRLQKAVRNAQQCNTLSREIIAPRQ